MSSIVEALNGFTQLAPCRLNASANQAGSYFNGSTNNGVGATFTYATGVLTIDSVIVKLGDFILFSAQTLGYQNGIYQCIVAGSTGIGAILQRRGDFQCLEQLKLGQSISIYAGTANAGQTQILIEPFPAAIGVPLVAGSNNINFL